MTGDGPGAILGAIGRIRSSAPHTGAQTGRETERGRERLALGSGSRIIRSMGGFGEMG